MRGRSAAYVTYATHMESKRNRCRWATGASALCAIALVTTPAPPACAGVELTTEISNASDAPAAQAKTPRPGRMLLDHERVRMELGSTDAGADRTAVLIYRGDRDVMWSVDAKRKTYTEVDRERMEAMRAQSEAARATMRAELGKLPPAEQARMQAMLAMSDTMTAPREPPVVKETGRTDKVGGLPCHEIELSRGGTKESEICVADWKAAGLTKADLAPMRKLVTFQQRAFGGMHERRGTDDVLELFDQLDGLAVRVRSFRAGQPRSEFRVVKIEHKAIDGKLFEPPDGYQKRTFSISMPGARGGPAKPPGAAAGTRPPADEPPGQ